MNAINSALALVGLALVACGQQLPEDANMVSAQRAMVEAPSATPAVGSTALFLKAKAELPACTPDNEAQLAYVVESGAFFACAAQEWTLVDVKGKDGSNGKDGAAGKDGLAGTGCSVVDTEEGAEVQCGDGSKALVKHGTKGEKGDRGDQGLQGVAGAAGRDGLDGVNGANGTNGADGRDGQDGMDGTAALPRLTDAAGQDLGIFVGYSMDAVRHYLAVLGDMRIAWDRTTGAPRLAYSLYAGANCTGTTWMLLENGQWENTAQEGETGRMLKQTGKAKSVTYASRRAFGGACSNTSGTALTAFDTVVVSDFPVALPVVSIQPVNQ